MFRSAQHDSRRMAHESRSSVEIWLGKRERVSNQFHSGFCIVGDHDFHNIEPEKNIGIIQHSQPGQRATRNSLSFFSIHRFDGPAEIFARHGFLLQQIPACHCHDIQHRFHRHCDRGNCGRGLCNRYASDSGTLTSRRARLVGDDRIWATSSNARSGCATGSKDRRWIGQGPNSWSFSRCSSVP